jgi:uncharacterized protein YjaG (DUF416 family)
MFMCAEKYSSSNSDPMNSYYSVAVVSKAQCDQGVFENLRSLQVRTACALLVSRVGQNYTLTVYIRYFGQGNHQIYDHIRCIYTVLANPTCKVHFYVKMRVCPLIYKATIFNFLCSWCAVSVSVSVFEKYWECLRAQRSGHTFQCLFQLLRITEGVCEHTAVCRCTEHVHSLKGPSIF